VDGDGVIIRGLGRHYTVPSRSARMPALTRMMRAKMIRPRPNHSTGPGLVDPVDVPGNQQAQQVQPGEPFGHGGHQPAGQQPRDSTSRAAWMV
jgi:hypothetical protein